MKTFLQTISLFALAGLSSPSAQAESAVGNGGHGLYCMRTNGNDTLELLDLYEAQSEYKLKIESKLPENSDGKSPDEIVDLVVVERIGDLAADLLATAGLEYGDSRKPELIVQKRLESIRAITVYLEGDDVLLPLDDVKQRVSRESQASEAHCFTVAIANYTDDGRLLIARKYYDMLSPLHKAALWAHEMIYEVARRSFPQMKDSRLVRKIVGKIFSTQRGLYKSFRHFYYQGGFAGYDQSKTYIDTSCTMVRSTDQDFEKVLSELNIDNKDIPTWVNYLVLYSWSETDSTTGEIVKTHTSINYTPAAFAPESRYTSTPDLIYYGTLSRMEFETPTNILLPSQFLKVGRENWAEQEYPAYREGWYIVQNGLIEVPAFKIVRRRSSDFIEVRMKQPNSLGDDYYSIPMRCLHLRHQKIQSKLSKELMVSQYHHYDTQSKKWKIAQH